MLLHVQNMHAHYGKSHVLAGVDLAAKAGSITSILGRNGAGRSTTLKAIMGIVKPSAGTIVFDGVDITGQRPSVAARLGLAFVPEERLVFTNLTVFENLRVGMQSVRPGVPAWSYEDMFEYFPRLKERRDQKAGTLSGGEQQMLTICRSLMGNPKVMLIDEPTEGLAPKIVDVLREVLVDIARRGVAILLVEQKLTMALKISHAVFVMGQGRIVFRGSVGDFLEDRDVREKWLHVS